MTKWTEAKVPVTRRALLQRLNRALAKRGEMIRTSRGNSATAELGHCFCIDIHRNSVEATHVDVEAWGRDLDILKPYEKLVD